MYGFSRTFNGPDDTFHGVTVYYLPEGAKNKRTVHFTLEGLEQLKEFLDSDECDVSLPRRTEIELEVEDV